MRLSGTKTGSANQYNGLGDQLYDLGGARPTLDLNFASNGSLVDSVTGKTLVTHTRASSGTYVDGDGIIKNAVTNLLTYSEEFDNASWVKATGTLTPNSITSPDGTQTAYLFSGDGASIGYLAKSFNYTSGNTYTYSIYAKKANTSTFSVLFYGTQFDAAPSVNTSATFNFDTESIAFVGGNITGSITSVGSGWYRCTATVTAIATGNTAHQLVRLVGVSGDVYIWGAQLEQSSTVGEYVKTTSTINSAPRFDHNPTTGESLGLLVEESRTNLLLQSENFGTTWGSINYTVTANAATAPDGTVTADKLIRNTTDTTTSITQNVTVTANTAYNYSVFVKASEWSKVGLREGSVSGNYVTFDLSNGTIVSSSVATGAITAFADGWYRISMQMTTGAAQTTYGIRLIPLPNSYTSGTPSYSFAGDGTSGVFAWGAQLEAGSFPTSYIPTTTATVTRAADVTSIQGNDFGTFNLLQYSEEFDQWENNGVTIKPNQLVAPDGTLTGDTVGNKTAGYKAIYKTNNVPVGTYTFSFYTKYVDNDNISFAVTENGSATILQRASLRYDTGVFTVYSGPAPTLEDVGNGWYRVKVTVTFTNATNNVFIYPGIYSDTTTGYVGVWGAQLEKSSTATPYVKSDVTWTSRASNATYYDYTGTLRKSSYNLITDSENIASWPSTAGVTKTANQAIAPDGTLTADYIEFGDANRTVYKFTTVTAGLPYTASVYVKGTAGETIRIASQGLPYTDYTLDGTWQRLTTSGTNATTSGLVTISTFGGVTARNVYLWGAQLETGPYAGDYAKTTSSAASSARNVAFLPDGSGNFVSAGELLLEDAGTNLVSDSEDIVGYFTEQNATVTADAATAPDGTTTADLNVPNTSLTTHAAYVNTLNLSGSTAYSYSIFVKPNGYNFVQLAFTSGFSNNAAWVNFNLTGTGSVGYTGGGESSNFIEALPNGWYRCGISATSGGTATGTGPVYIPIDSDRNSRDPNYAGDGTSGLYVWGAQLEQNPYATSYIPTYGSTATRAADVSSSSSNTFGNSFYNQTEGTVFSDHVWEVNSDFSTIWGLSDGTSSNEIRLIGWNNGTDRGPSVTTGGVGQVNGMARIYDGNVNYRYAIVIKQDSVASSRNGDSILFDTSATLPTVSSLHIGSTRGIAFTAASRISRLTYWPTRLSNDTLQTITV